MVGWNGIPTAGMVAGTVPHWERLFMSMKPRIATGERPRTARLREALRRPVVMTLPDNPFQRGLLVGGLMLLAAAGDFLSGPFLATQSFYALAVVVGVWGQGWRASFFIPLIAGILDALSDALHPLHPPINTLFVANQALNLAIYFFLGWLSGLAGQQQQRLAAQRDALARASEQMEDDLFAARNLQALLMDAPPDHPAIDSGAYFDSANILGGDAAILHLDQSGCLAFGVADVSGKGSPAALAAAVLVGLLEDAPGRYRSTAETLQYLNQRLAERLPSTSFVTMFYGLLNLHTGELTYSSAGHDPAILFRADGRFEALAATGMVLGVSQDATFGEEKRFLSPDDLIFCYTDGLTDMRDEAGNRLGFERARYLAATRLQQSCPELVESVVRAARDETVAAPDDIMLVAARYLGMPASLKLPTEPEVPLPHLDSATPAVTAAGKGAPWRPV